MAVDARIAAYGNPFTDAAMARLLSPLPAEGSRDTKIQKFNGDVLGWVAESGFEVHEELGFSTTFRTEPVDYTAGFRNYKLLIVIVTDNNHESSFIVPVAAIPTSGSMIFGEGFKPTNVGASSNLSFILEPNRINKSSSVDGFLYIAFIK